MDGGTTLALVLVAWLLYTALAPRNSNPLMHLIFLPWLGFIVFLGGTMIWNVTMFAWRSMTQ
jgi:hypothetical protein